MRRAGQCKYPANPLIAREWAPHYSVSHVSGPHAIWIDEEQKLFVCYATVSALADTALQPIGLDEARGKLVLEGTIDTLPSHHSLVTRWLKVYVVYDISERQIAHLTFTIRGQILE